jgi:Protein of unknown function (DUF1552)
MKRPVRLTRRTVLRGMGAAIALPWLEAMAPVGAWADGLSSDKGNATPKRMAFLYVPNGVHMADWTPKESGPGFQIPPTLKALEAYKDQLLVLTGLAQNNADALGDGPGDHARSLACFLTGTHPLKTNGAGIRVGISVDQAAAQVVGRQTRLPSLELGIERGAQSGNCDSGYSCAYSSNISWRSANMPMAKEINPKLVFDRLFASRSRSGSAADRIKRELYQRSILDLVLDDAQQLHKRIGMSDRRKIDEYLTAVREVEMRITQSEKAAKSLPANGLTRPKGIPDDVGEHIRLMFDLIALSFQCDATRICTFMYANEGSNRSYPSIDVTDGHHDLSHHGGDVKKHEKLKIINRFHIEQFAYLLGKLKSISEGPRSLLDTAMIVYGSGISDGDRHNHDDLPVLMAGKGGGTIKPGRHLKVEPQPLNNLFLAMLDRLGVSLDRLGDSTGRLGKLDG